MHQELQQVFNFSITIREVIVNTLLATFCGGIISCFYILTFRGVGYSINLIRSIVMLSMITAFIMMVIGDNLAQAFGMVGILSIIQFRAAMKGAQDFMFLFFALAIGLSCGEGLYTVALAGCFLIGLITIGTAKVLASTKQRYFTLNVIRSATQSDRSQHRTVLSSFCKKYELISTKLSTKGNDSFIRFSYTIRMKNSEDSDSLVYALKAIEGVMEVNLLSEDE
ncbi:DUF4956 domain-containing protein [Spirosoma aerolatum]|uniref:DUF4956 domain-containing protein n=1 Tax=Spirosoma aerolatum TaxID=1211326 RepID=UPI0009AD84BA|nr:DUF4956 domain-containing protein [Spirosoma aerolatum]